MVDMKSEFLHNIKVITLKIKLFDIKFSFFRKIFVLFAIISLMLTSISCLCEFIQLSNSHLHLEALDVDHDSHLNVEFEKYVHRHSNRDTDHEHEHFHLKFLSSVEFLDLNYQNIKFIISDYYKLNPISFIQKSVCSYTNEILRPPIFV